ncbi:hypothetical protein DFH07DRAFT_771055 [Mycena maculata]|uniref:Uncharacterized protein n=1 Tax=Mycena maculata TaxID=230809 RepID=A0AAD7JEP8_9AGAR|nr:hypothetical protein DFH07DRAFT_771055 [Mycena maculata]
MARPPVERGNPCRANEIRENEAQATFHMAYNDNTLRTCPSPSSHLCRQIWFFFARSSTQKMVGIAVIMAQPRVERCGRPLPSRKKRDSTYLVQERLLNLHGREFRPFFRSPANRPGGNRKPPAKKVDFYDLVMARARVERESCSQFSSWSPSQALPPTTKPNLILCAGRLEPILGPCGPQSSGTVFTQKIREVCFKFGICIIATLVRNRKEISGEKKLHPFMAQSRVERVSCCTNRLPPMKCRFMRLHSPRGGEHPQMEQNRLTSTDIPATPVETGFNITDHSSLIGNTEHTEKFGGAPTNGDVQRRKNY